MNIIDLLDIDKIKDLVLYKDKAPLLFNSGAFFVLFIGFFAVYLLLENRQRARFFFTVIFSVYFYYKASGFYFWLLILSTFVDYHLGNAIYRADSKVKKRFLLSFSLVANLGMLAYFKYYNFGLSTVNTVFGTGFPLEDIFLPVGISFYTFQTLSYSIDIYRGELKPAKTILDFAFFVTFFPQLVAGPIVRASDFIPQMYEKLRITREELSRGILLIAGGLFKKAVISDYISINFVDRVFDNPLLYSSFENLMAVYGYAFQIYCDFSGYSDMAIGISLLLGFKLPLNFDSPYQSASITEFWRRWHISLSSWLRDYLYIPLGGNRKGKVRTYINLFLTMLIGGLWHGANWKFIIWGALHGAMLALEKLWWSIVPPRKNAVTRFFGILFTFHFVCFCWIFFRADSFSQAVEVIRQIVKPYDLTLIREVLLAYRNVFLVLLMAVILHLVPKNIEIQYGRLFEKTPLPFKAVYLSVVIWIVIQVANAEVQPFIYFQF